MRRWVGAVRLGLAPYLPWVAHALLGVLITGLSLGEKMSMHGLILIMEGNNDVVVISENNPMKTIAKQKKK